MNAKILIIEDEFLIRNQLSQIDWSQTGAALSGAFPDTRSAWDFVKHNHPDILITDIQLGDENGLEFAQKLKSHLPKLKIIVLTAHNIVEYTKSAIDVGVMAYLLKPIDKEQLISTVKSAAEAVEKDCQNTIMSSIANSFKENKHLLKSYFLSACSSKRHSMEMNALFDLPDTAGLCSAIIVKFYESGNVFSDFLNIKELLTSSADYYLLPFYEPELFMFFVKFKFSQSTEAALSQCIEIANTIKKFLDFNYSESEMSYSIGLGEIVSSAAGFNLSCKSALNCLEHSFYMGRNQIIYCQDVEPSTDIISYKDSIDSCISCIRIGNKDGAMSQIDILFENFKENTVKIEIVQRICLEFIVTISTALIQIGQNPNYLFNKFDIWAYLKRFNTLDSLKALIQKLVAASIAQINDIRSTKTSKLIFDITEYLDKNYMQPLTLEDVAKRFYISTCYLSTIFKQKTNMNFKEYLSMLKFNKAKELLSETNESIQEIALKLGYSSSSYFSKAFHHKTGYVPSEYRLKFKKQ